MTVREAILRRLGNGPAAAPQLVDAAVEFAKAKRGTAYAEVFSALNSLIEAGHVTHNTDLRVYVLGKTAQEKPKPPAYETAAEQIKRAKREGRIV